VSTPVSWLVVERGWKVIGVDGTELGTVEEVLGDKNADIFDGLALATDVFHARYVPSEQVSEISDGEVHVALREPDVERLEPYEGAPPTVT
jgi:hypothetical protein